MSFAAFSLSAAASFAVASTLVLSARAHGRYTMDMGGGLQTFHSRPAPRIGGIAIYVALILAWRISPDPEVARMIAIILVAAVPVLATGLAEDLTRQVPVSARLLAALASAASACSLSAVAISVVDIPLADSLLAHPALALAFTIFAVAGVTNSLNIIDGLHGLASGTAVICILALATISASVGDSALCLASLTIAGAVAGFWLVNFPWGKLFLGDGGAYLVGFALAWLAVLLPTRNPGVSPWASLLVCAYPIIEVIYSMARRRGSRRPASHADRCHLHSLMAERILEPRLRQLDPALRNALGSVPMWACAALPAFAAVALYAHTSWLAAGAAASLLLYHWLYRRVARI